jgi:formate dehydrogenase iron-sulfur subunit
VLFRSGGLVLTAANLVRLARGERIEWWGAVRLALRRLRWLSALAIALSLGGIAAGLAGPLPLAVGLVFGGELIGRYLFYVTVVPLDMPGSFYRSMA